jgi:hypothetical protein
VVEILVLDLMKQQHPGCVTTSLVKTYVHARLCREDRAVLEALKAAMGQSESALVRRAIRLAARELSATRSAKALAGRSVERFASGRKDLSSNRRHLDGFAPRGPGS